MKILLLSFIFIVSSCAQNALKRNPSQAEEVNYSSDTQKLVKTTKIRAVEKKEETSDSQIYGTAQIEKANQTKPHTYYLYGAEHLNLKNYYFDIPVVYNKQVKKWMSYFLNRGKNYFVRYAERAGRYAPVLGRILEDQGLPRDLIFLAMAESGFQNKAKSWAKAVGPWQFMPYTGKRFGLHIDWYLDERRDPIKATVAAATYLRLLHDMFGSWELAAAGYNAGEGKVRRAIKRYKTKNFWKIAKGRYLKPETKNYVPKIMALAIIGKNLSSFGFKDIDFDMPLDFDEVEVGPNTDLYKVAEATGIDFQELHKLNPEIMRWQTPPNVASYKLRLPVGMRAYWGACCANLDLKARDYQEYKMRSYSSIRAVAKKLKVPVKVIAKLNNDIPTNQRLRKGTLVKIPFREGQSRKHKMFSDLYEKPRKSVRRWRKYASQLKKSYRRGKNVSNPSEWYVVKKGESLWSVAKKNGVSLDTLIKSNYRLVKSRMVRPGDKLVIR